MNEAVKRVRDCVTDPQVDPKQHLFFETAPLQGGLRATKAFPQMRSADSDDSDEVLEPKIFTLAEARQLVRDSGSMDMKTVLGLSLI